MTSPSRAGVAIGLAAAAVLVLNVAGGLDRPLAKTAPDGYRYWEDFGAAVRLFRGPAPAPSVPTPFATDFEAAESEVRRLDIRPWQFWRTADPSVFPGPRTIEAVRPLEDLGRARILAFVFHVRSGIAPVALFWLAVALAIPLLVWTGWEMARAGHLLSAAVFLLAVAASAFVADALPLAYSPMGFYLVAVLLVVPWATVLVVGAPTVQGVIVRALAAGIGLAVCAACRSSVLLVLPGLLVALAVGARRLRLRPGPVLAAAALVVVPPAAVRALSGGGHDVWITLWEGLGDFDRSKGHAWSDAVAKRFVRARGVHDLRAPEAQPLFRRRVLRSIGSDPTWYAGILARRLGSTLSQSKLWGPGLRASTDPAEGAMDDYYRLARTVDVFAAGTNVVEVPAALLLVGPILLAGAIAHPRWRAAAAGPAAVVACVLAATLGVPVLVSTAGALETETAALAWLLAWAFVIEDLVRLGRSPTSAGAGPPRDARPAAGPPSARSFARRLVVPGS